MKKDIGIWGHPNQGTKDGFGYAGMKLVESLKRHGYDTLWMDPNCPVTLAFTQPLAYPPASLSRFDIGYTPWESTVLPTEDPWVKHMNTRDEMWTTSSWCKQAFEENGVTVPLKVVKHYLDPEDWQIQKRSFKKPFIFLHIGEPAERKGSQLVFDAFVKTFGNNPDVQLVFKARAWVEARWKDNKGSIIGPVDLYPNVHIVKGTYTLPQMNQIMHQANCLLYPSNGEGFGLIPFEAIATGLPTVLPAYSGMKEFSDYGINIDFGVGLSNHGYHLGEWCWPDFDDLCATMQEMYDYYDDWSESAFKWGHKLREDFSEEAVMGPVLQELDSRY